MCVIMNHYFSHNCFEGLCEVEPAQQHFHICSNPDFPVVLRERTGVHFETLHRKETAHEAIKNAETQ